MPTFEPEISWYIEKDNPVTPERPYKTTSIDRARTPQEIGRQLVARLRELTYEIDGEPEPFVDEYASARDFDESPPLPAGMLWWRIIVYTVEGTSEGDYIHVDGIPNRDDEKRRPIALIKTFRGRDHAWAMARIIADLLGV